MYFSYKSIIVYKKRPLGTFVVRPECIKKVLEISLLPFIPPYVPGIIGKILLFFKSLNMIWMENDDVIIYFSWSLPWENVQWGAPTGSLLREEAHKKNEHKNHQKRVFVKFSSRREERGESSSLCGNSNYFFYIFPIFGLQGIISLVISLTFTTQSQRFVCHLPI